MKPAAYAAGRSELSFDQLRSARAVRIGASGGGEVRAMGGLAGVVLGIVLAVPGVAAGVPVVPIGVLCWLCWPAAVAGFGDVVLGGVPCALAKPAERVSAIAARAACVERFMSSLMLSVAS
jgi:hypothetical protein